MALVSRRGNARYRPLDLLSTPLADWESGRDSATDPRGHGPRATGTGRHLTASAIARPRPRPVAIRRSPGTRAGLGAPRPFGPPAPAPPGKTCSVSPWLPSSQGMEPPGTPGRFPEARAGEWGRPPLGRSSSRSSMNAWTRQRSITLTRWITPSSPRSTRWLSLANRSGLERRGASSGVVRLRRSRVERWTSAAYLSLIAA
jgi:hypothetical protein